MRGVFLSYARQDETRATEIRERLTREAPDIPIKQDRILLEGGVGWWKQITDAIDSVEFLVLLVTPGALESGNVQKEWRYARRQGVCVYPVKGAPDAELQFPKMPHWMHNLHFYDLNVDQEWPTFIAHLRKGCDARRIPFMAPFLPPQFTERPAEYEALKNLLLTPDRSQPVAITTALSGAGGFGKTTLAAALCHDEDIIENFDDGIMWVTLGQTPNVLGCLLALYAALTGERPGFSSVEDAGYQLGQKLEERTCLLVVDDVWDQEHLRPFLRGGMSSARLFTTRDASIASAARPVNVDQMREEEAVSMLAKGVADLGAGRAKEISRRLGQWPLALELASGMIRERVRQGDSAGHAAERLLKIVERKGIGVLQDPTAERRHRTISSVLEVSLDLLGAADRRRLAELSIFPEDVAIPLAAAAAVWGLDESDSEEVAQHLAQLSLVKLDLRRGVLRLHDVMREWLAGQLADSRDVHDRLVKAWPGRRNLPDLPGQYAWRWLPWHLAQGGKRQEIELLLWDPVWMQAKLKAADVNALVADYELLKPSTEAELLQGALRLSAHVLAADAGQFASQMVGRLQPHCDSPRIRCFSEGVAAAAVGPWLRPLRPTLHSPGDALVRTLVGHCSAVAGVAITPDGRRAVSASWDHTLKVWDLETGRVLSTLTGHSSGIYGVALTPDGQRAISASKDHTLKVWDLDTGRALCTLKGHSSDVHGVAVTPDGKRAVSASGENTLKMWDLETSSELVTLEGHSSAVTGVVVSPDGRRAVSASRDQTLKVWDLETDRALRTLEGHSDFVSGVAVSPDGQRAVSASGDQTLKVWDLETGRAMCTLEGHSYSVYGVAVTPDGLRAISASRDRSLKVWNLEAGRALPAPRAHSGYVLGIAVTPDGQRIVSASDDETLKLWDLETGRGLRTLAGHSDSVWGVAVTPDGQRAVSASRDRTLKVWDLKTGRALHTLVGHSDCVDSVAVTPDGQRAVSACGDNTLKVWDLETGCALRTLEGHSDCVWGVAVTPDGRRAVSASRDRTLKIWDLESGGALRTLEGHSGYVLGVAVTPDGKRMVSASGDNTLKVWDLETGRILRTLEGHSDFVLDVAVTPNGRRAVSGSEDKTLRVWDLETGLALATFNCDASAQCCTFASNRQIIAGDAVGRLHFLLLEGADSA
jgi:WD40 repeat protein